MENILYSHGEFTSRDELILFEQSWQPKDDMKAAIVLHHGLAEHSSRYTGLAEFLNEHGYGVFTYDARGHGKSNGRSCYIERFEDCTNDLHLYIAKVRKVIGDKPVFLFGHSFGGEVVMAYVISRLPDLKGIILSSPALMPGEDVSPLLIKIGGLINKVFPKLEVVAIDSAAISRDESEVKKYQEDPLIFHRKIPARTGWEINRNFEFIDRGATRVTTPILIVHGTADRLTNVQGSKNLYKRIGSDDKTINLYDDGYHELFNDLDRDKVKKDLLDWLEAHYK